MSIIGNAVEKIGQIKDHFPTSASQLSNKIETKTSNGRINFSKLLSGNNSNGSDLLSFDGMKSDKTTRVKSAV